MSRKARGWAALSGAVLTACAWTWAHEGDQTGRVDSHLLLYGAAFAAYLAGLAATRGLSRCGLVLALALALGWRVALVAAPPLLSDDVYRSLWEGRVQLHGGNPYLWSDRPEAPAWAALRDDAWARINHKDYAAVYPPVWQMAMAAIVRLRDSVSAVKAFLVGCEVLTWWALAALLRRRGQPRERLLILAWSPLALVEIAGSGHNEGLGLLLATLSLLALENGWRLASSLAAAAGVGVKLLPGLLAAAWARRYRPWHVLAAAAALAVTCLPYAGAGWEALLSLAKYAKFFRFNETAFALLAATFGDAQFASLAGASLVLVLALFLAGGEGDPARAALAIVVAWIVLAPSVFPWYALWLLPFLVLHDAPGALLFTGTVALAYLVYPDWQSGERWQLGWGLRALEYGPCLVVAGWGVLAGARRERVPAASVA